MPQTTLSVVLEVAPESARPLLKIIEQVSGAEETWRPGDTELYSRLKWGVPSLHFMSMSVFHGADYDPIFVDRGEFRRPSGAVLGAARGDAGRSESAAHAALLQAPR